MLLLMHMTDCDTTPAPCLHAFKEILIMTFAKVRPAQMIFISTSILSHSRSSYPFMWGLLRLAPIMQWWLSYDVAPQIALAAVWRIILSSST